MDIQRQAFESHFKATKIYTREAQIRQKDILEFSSNFGYFNIITNNAWEMWQAAKASAVPEANKREGGYYIRDLRSPIGNCMKFWYQAGYGTKHKNFFLCETLEEAKKYRGGCTRFEIWHAPYIDSLVEYTVDFQLADRSVGLVDLNAQAVA